MAYITSNSEKSVFKIDNFLGLNESPDGDAGLKDGEAAVMRNWRITAEKNIQVRPGSKTVLTLSEGGSPVRGLWRGAVAGNEHILCACGGKLFDLKGIDSADPSAVEIGTLADADTHFFGFSNAVYIMNGTQYMKWTGEGNAVEVEGYIPIIATATPPSGGGKALEEANVLTGKRRQQFSADGEATVFQLAEIGISSVVSVSVAGAALESGYTVDADAGTVTFEEAPVKGANNVEITYDTGAGNPDIVRKMRFSETYNGYTDSRVFLYGDGSNVTIYSGLDEYGQPSAEYFPALNQIAVDKSNTPITAMVRHYGNLVIYKTDSVFQTTYDTITLADGTVTAAFSIRPINRSIGNECMGAVLLVYNNPRSLYEGACYEWKPNYSGGVSDERNASRISDRVADSMRSFDLSRCVTFDDERSYEYWICYDGAALVHNYRTDTWCKYTGLPITCMVQTNNSILFGSTDGKVKDLSTSHRNDDDEAISAYWESGSIDFNYDWRRKFISVLYVVMKPESNGRVSVTCQTDRKSDYADKVISTSLATLSHVDFNHFSFGTNRKPKTRRIKLKAKKFAFYKLIFESESASSTATVLGADLVVRYAGNVK